MATAPFYTLQQIGDILKAPVRLGEPGSAPQEIFEYCIDSRQVFHPESALFIALQGEKRDGHDFIQAAWEKGVRNFLVSKPEFVPSQGNYIQVNDPLEAFQKLAAWHRKKFSFPVLAITGSNGKTIVKEWLASVLTPDFQIEKSPKSFNSQVGVALSVMGSGIPAGPALGIFEAGISKAGEMEKLEQILKPDIGMITHFGDAHSEGFGSAEEKLEEKMKLFKGANLLLVSAEDGSVLSHARKNGLPVKTVGLADFADIKVEGLQDLGNGWEFSIREGEDREFFRFNQTGPAALENILLVILAARHFGLSFSSIARRITRLHPVSMRMEMITDNPEITLINDAYNADLASIQNAFSLLKAESSQSLKALILTDIEHQGERQESVERHILELALSQFPKEKLILIGPVFKKIALQEPGLRAFADTDAFLNQFDYDGFRHHVVLLKGARHFQLERIIPYLSQRVTATEFRINMDYLRHNYLQFRNLIPGNVKIMAMVKAFSYGSGSWEIAQALALEGVNYLAVAYTAEGITLRNRGINTPIMVMNPDLKTLEQLFRFDLEPEVFGMDFLKELVMRGNSLGTGTIKVHLKVDTGMHRLGFSPEERLNLRDYLKAHPQVEVVSILSHLAAADEEENDDFTRKQVSSFLNFVDALEFGEDKKPIRHILNTAGILRFPQDCLNMVRLGIGLYGVAPFAGAAINLKEIGSLHSVVSQVHHYEKGARIGYGLSEGLKEPSVIATVPIGYADGIRRSLSNGGMSFLVRGKRAPVIGRICMDMLMLNVTGIPDVSAGDEVVLLGKQGGDFISAHELGVKCGTIPYEILTSISQRVRRVYSRE